MANGQRIWLAVSIAAVVLVGAASLFVTLIIGHSQPMTIAELPGPDGTAGQYVLEYARNGDLIFSPKRGNPIIKYYDYYGDLTVVNTRWLADDHVIITMQNGLTLHIRSKFDMHYPTTQPGSQSQSSPNTNP